MDYPNECYKSPALIAEAINDSLQYPQATVLESDCLKSDVFLPQTFEFEKLLIQENESYMDGFFEEKSYNVPFETRGFTSSEMTGNMVEEFKEFCSKTTKYFDETNEEHQNWNLFDTLNSPNEESSPVSQSLPPDHSKYPIVEKKDISSVDSYWLEWKKVLNDWLRSDDAKTTSANHAASILKTKSIKLTSFGDEFTKDYPNMDNYFDAWCKYYTRIYLMANGPQFMKSDLYLSNLNIDPFGKFQDYKFRENELTMDPLRAVCEGCMSYAKGDMERAIICFENVLIQKEDTASSWYYLGLAQSAAGNDDQAICALKRSLILDFSRHEVYLELASSFINENLFSAACKMLCIWLCMYQQNEGLPKSCSAYGKIRNQMFGFFNLNEMPKSLVEDSDLLNLLNIFIDVATTGVAASNHENMEKTLNLESLQEENLKPSFHEALDPDFNTSLALLYIMIGNLEEANRCLVAAIQKKNRSPRLWNKLGSVLVEEKNYGEAVNAFMHALEIWPGYAKVRCNLASLCHRQGLHREAAQHLVEVVLQQGKENSKLILDQLEKIIFELNNPEQMRAWKEEDLVVLRQILSVIPDV